MRDRIVLSIATFGLVFAVGFAIAGFVRLLPALPWPPETLVILVVAGAAAVLVFLVDAFGRRT